MPDFVLDCSLTLPWCFADEATAYTEHVRRRLRAGSEALVPGLWLLEVRNGLLSARRRGRISEQDAGAFLAALRHLPIAVYLTGSAETFDRIYALAAAEQLTAYDAAYLDLAIQENLALASLDRAMREAAGRVGVPLLAES